MTRPAIPSHLVPLVSAWLAREGHTILTAPPSLVARALAKLQGED